MFREKALKRHNGTVPPCIVMTELKFHFQAHFSLVMKAIAKDMTSAYLIETGSSESASCFSAKDIRNAFRGNLWNHDKRVEQRRIFTRFRLKYFLKLYDVGLEHFWEAIETNWGDYGADPKDESVDPTQVKFPVKHYPEVSQLNQDFHPAAV